MESMNFQGQRVLITGAGKGIGRDIAILMAQLGADVVALSRTDSDLESLRAEINCTTLCADLTDADAAKNAAQEAGPIDLLVNNAGISIPQSFLETTPEAFDQTLAVNVRAVMIISQVIAGDLIARNAPGAIVNVSSTAAQRGLTDHAAYCASKGALDQLTRVMALELGPHNIRVNAVNPTVTLTPMAEMAWSDPTKSAGMMARIPLQRFALPRDVSGVVAFLLSSQAAMIHGATLPIDGGFLAV
jgi:NAD(P)-dependent dehydrogenase (short-subunit alcohol dehydrogenase family)